MHPWSAINFAFKWLHQVAGVDSPTLHPIVISAKEGALRLVSQPASHRKEPLGVIHLKQLTERTDCGNLLQLRSLGLVMFVLAFSGFFYRIMLETRYLAGLKSLNLCPSERKPFLSLSSMGPGLPMRPCLKVLFCVFGCVLEAKYAICVN